MLSVLFHTLGCKINQLESEALADAFTHAGFRLCKPDDVSPSIILINTCTVTSKADQKARRVIRQALRDNPLSCVLVTGCYAQLDKEQIMKLDDGRGRFFVFKSGEKNRLLELPVFLCEKENDPDGVIRDWIEKNSELDSNHGVFDFSPERFSNHTRGFLKIQDGCDKHCTYCRIRLARGNSVSLNAPQVLERLRLLEGNHAEAVLAGVNISQYRDETSTIGSLAELLDYLLNGTEKIALRLSSLEPDSIDENLAKILSNKRIRPHFHLSIQSGSETILEKMGRSYTPETIEKTVNLLRSVKNDPFLACDMITGFPGENEAEFKKTYELCQKYDFAWIHVFPYSKRPGTPAWLYKNLVHEADVTGRVQMLTDLAAKGKIAYISRWFDREIDVLIEKGGSAKNPGNFCRGTSENYLKLLIQCEGDTPHAGTVLRCIIPSNQKIKGLNKLYDAVAKPLDKKFENV
ncbi:MAG: tRNA (N(6)-L-threonylcarbamoyladenosine(37)-C(2))-methylthiotransferase MtaB [Treponema sp.]|jgi:threonylcarbamoyladenosine tRNA methylthiotransferase MtaB|nr:tRNA (N(6)-L-threonylcarbamoyladenosine(37)-C(2))-methylthiotransferase MtaB [Treponema sp.]